MSFGGGETNRKAAQAKGGQAKSRRICVTYASNIPALARLLGQAPKRHVKPSRNKEKAETECLRSVIV